MEHIYLCIYYIGINHRFKYTKLITVYNCYGYVRLDIKTCIVLYTSGSRYHVEDAAGEWSRGGGGVRSRKRL